MKNDQDSKEINNFLYNVAWLRAHYGLSKKKMAELLGISISSLNKIERGELPPRLSISLIYEIAKHFDISAEDQLTQRLGE